MRAATPAKTPSRRRWIAGRTLGARAARIAIGVVLGVGVMLGALYFVVASMPGKSRAAPLPPLSETESSARDAMKKDLAVLAGDIGERNYRNDKELERAAAFIEERLRDAGYAPSRQVFKAGDQEFANVEARLEGTSRELVVLGAHYDSVLYSPGANDNGTGVVALLELARRLHGASPAREIRFVFFANEEPPYFGTDDMGSAHYADELAREGARVSAMLSLETMGYYDDAKGSQPYPPILRWFYPDRGDFIAFVGNVSHRGFVRAAIGTFREVATLPSEGAAAPTAVPGVDWSDHGPFWRHGWPAAMVTDTAVYRYPHYHQTTDTPDRVDYDRLARVVVGLEHVARVLAKIP